MTQPRDPEAILSAYLAVGMEVLPDRVVEFRPRRGSSDRQRVVLRRGRTRSTFRIALVAAAVVAVVAIGGAFAAFVGPSPTPSANPSPSLPGVVAPSSTPSATAPNPSAFPLTSGVWIATGSLGTPRSGHDAVRLLDGRVLVVGGAEGDENDTSAEVYDPVSGTWSATGSMLKPHAGPATLLLDGRVLVGDIDEPGADNPVEGSELYDPATGTWSVTGTMVLGGFATATLLRDGKVLVRSDGGSELFDPDTGTWTATRSKPVQRPQPRGHPAATARCSWWAATSMETPRQTRPSCTTPTRDPGPRAQPCTPSAMSSRPSSSLMARCSWSAPVAGTPQSAEVV